jgi:hypothetical protein
MPAAAANSNKGHSRRRGRLGHPGVRAPRRRAMCRRHNERGSPLRVMATQPCGRSVPLGTSGWPSPIAPRHGIGPARLLRVGDTHTPSSCRGGLATLPEFRGVVLPARGRAAAEYRNLLPRPKPETTDRTSATIVAEQERIAEAGCAADLQRVGRLRQLWSVSYPLRRRWSHGPLACSTLLLDPGG